MGLLLTLAAALASAQTQTPSFDCAKATTRVEKTICANAELARLDELLGRFYFGALDVLSQSPCMKDDQRQWLASVRNRCDDATCLRKAYLERLSALLMLQPGMNVPN